MVPELRRTVSLSFMAAVAIVVLYQMHREHEPAVRMAEQRIAANAAARPADAQAGGQPHVPPQKQRFGGIPNEWWTGVHDDTPLCAAENKAFFGLLHALRKIPHGKLAAQSSGPVAYTQLFLQPQAYRGELVTLSGRVRRAFRLAASNNEQGIDHLYQTWLQPSDRSEPVVIYLAELPQGFPEGMDLDEEVRVHAVFFKRWPYRAASGLRSAPLLLARSFEWQPRSPDVARAQVGRGLGTLMPTLALTIAGGLLLILLFVWYSRSPGRRPRFSLRGHAEGGPQSSEAASDPRAFLKQLAQAATTCRDEGE